MSFTESGQEARAQDKINVKLRGVSSRVVSKALGRALMVQMMMTCWVKSGRGSVSACSL